MDQEALEKTKVEELKESVKETGEENERIKKQKAREVTDAAASAKNDETNDKITKQKAREVTDAAASAKNDETNDKITKQKAREVTDAAASAKNDETNDKITKRKAREVTNAAASAKKDVKENDKIAKRKAREVTNAEASAKYEETSQKLVSGAQYGKELKNEFAGMKNAVGSMKAKHKVDIDLKNTKIEELKEQIKTSNANNKANKAENKVEEKSENERETTNIDDNAEMKTNDINNDSSDQVKDMVKKVEERIAIARHGKAEKANSLTLQGVASARNPPCGILTPSDGGEISKKKTRRKSAEEAKKDYSETEDMMNSSESQTQELQNSRIKLESSSNVAELARKELEPLLEVKEKFEEALTKIEALESIRQEFVSKENKWKTENDRDQLQMDEMESEIRNLSEQIELKGNGNSDLEERLSKFQNTLSTSQSEVEEYKKKFSALEDAHGKESFSHDDLEQLENTAASSIEPFFMMDKIDAALDDINIGKDEPELTFGPGSVAPLFSSRPKTGLDCSFVFDRGWPRRTWDDRQGDRKTDQSLRTRRERRFEH